MSINQNSSSQSTRQGDFLGNQVLNWTPIPFTVEFISRMRKNQKKLQYIPSSRQAVAIPKLITAIYYRKSILIPEDFIKAAVLTTPIEDQTLARKIAFDILFPKPFSPGKATHKQSSSVGQQALQKNLPNLPNLPNVPQDPMDFMDDLPSQIRDKGRLRIMEAQAAIKLGDLQKVEEILQSRPSVADVREGEVTLSNLWFEMHEKRIAAAENVPIDKKLRQRVRENYPPPSWLDFRQAT